MKREDYNITDQKVIQGLLGFPENFPVKPLICVGFKKYLGDNLPGTWSQNGYFEVGKEYPIYQTDVCFALGAFDTPQKCDSNAWGKLVIR